MTGREFKEFIRNHCKDDSIVRVEIDEGYGIKSEVNISDVTVSPSIPNSTIRIKVKHKRDLKSKGGVHIKTVGTVPVYYTVCPECGSAFTYTKGDTEGHSMNSDLNGNTIECPVCHTRSWASFKRYNEKDEN